MKRIWNHYRYALAGFAVSAILVITGLIKGQQLDVLAKAVKICLECVGIG